MAYINIAQPDGKPRHINVTLSYNRVLLSSERDFFTMDYYDARELARMIRDAATMIERGEMQ